MGQKHWNSNEFNARLAKDSGAYTNETMQASPGTGFRLYVTDVVFNCGATGITASLLDGSGGTVLWKQALAANTSCNVHFAVPLKLTAATLLALTTSAQSIGMFVGVNGFVSK